MASLKDLASRVREILFKPGLQPAGNALQRFKSNMGIEKGSGVLTNISRMGLFGPLPPLAHKISKAFPETTLPMSHFVSGMAGPIPAEKIALGEKLPQRDKYKKYRVAGGATTGLITGGPKMVAGAAGFGGAFSGGAKALENVIKRRPISSGVGQAAKTGAMYGAETSPTFALTNSVVDHLSKTVKFLKPLTQKSIQGTLPKATQTLAEWSKNLGKTGIKRVFKAALIETPVEALTYGIKDQREGQKLVDSIAEQAAVNFTFNVGLAGVNTVFDARTIAPLVNNSINKAFKQHGINPEAGAAKIPGETIPKELELLAQEARKYKSGDEFENAAFGGKINLRNFGFEGPEPTRLMPGRIDKYPDGFPTSEYAFVDFYNQATKQPKIKVSAPEPAKITGDALETTKGQIGSVKIKTPFKQKLSDFYTDWVNRTQPIERLEKGVEKELNASIRPEFSPTIKIKKLFGAGGKAELRYKQKLAPILDSVSDIPKADFDAFMKAHRDVELGGRGIKGSDPELARRTITSLSEKYDINQLNQAADQLYAYQRENLNMLREGGFLSDEAISKITAKNQKYVPFERVMGEVDNYLGLPTSKLQHPAQPIKGIKGSDRKILSPVESIIANTYKTEAAVSKNNVARSIVGLKKLLPELPITKSSKSQGAITVWEGGKKTYYTVPGEIENVVKGLNEESMDSLTKVLSAPARMLRQQATGRNLEFMIPNVVRDQFDAAINSKYGYKPFIGYIEGLRHMLNYKLTGNDDVLEAWINSGGKMFFESMEGRKTISQQVKDTGRRSLIKRLGEWVVGGIETVGEFSEEPTRVGLFKQGLKKTGNVDLAMLESREGTIDFARRGAKMKTANALVPFLNVGVQGFDRMLRTVKDNPGGTSLALLAYAAVPSTMTSIYNNMFHAEDWKTVPDFEKQGNFVIMTGGRDEEGNAKYIKIPKAYGQRYVANPIQELITFAAGNNPQGFKQFALNFIGESLPVIEGGSTIGEAVSKTVGSNLPQFAKVPTQLAANYDFFRSKPIVPWYLENKPPAEQSYESTEGAYKKIGQVLNVSPLKVKNALESTFAGGIKQPEKIIKTINAIVDGEKPSPNDVFVLRRFLGSYSGFDIERPETAEQKPLIERLVSTDSKVEAASLPESTEDLNVLYKDAMGTISRYRKNKVKAQYGLVQKSLKEYQTEMDQAIQIKKMIEKERPEQVFEIELNTYASGKGQTTKARSEWAIKKLESTEEGELQGVLNQMWESGVLTTGSKGTAEYLKTNFGINPYSYTGENSDVAKKVLKGGGKGRKGAKIAIKKATMPKLKFSKLGGSVTPSLKMAAPPKFSAKQRKPAKLTVPTSLPAIKMPGKEAYQLKVS